MNVTKMKIYFHVTFVFYLVFRKSLADFDCQEVTNKTANSQKELNCIYDDFFKVKSGTSYYCRCKTVITGLFFPENSLKYDKLVQVCSKEERLEQLWINNMELEHFDNEIFEKFQKLTYVNLAGNNILVNFNEKAANLIKLDLSDNKLNSMHSDFLKNFKSLEILNLSFNRLDVIDFVSNNTKLKEIYLNNNHINAIDGEEFGYLCELRILNLAHNQLNLLLSLYLCSIQELYLQNNKFKRVNLIIEIHNMKILKLETNFLNDTKLAVYGIDTEQLFLENNKIVKIDSTMTDSNDVVCLNLSNNLIKSIEANTFSPDNSIKILDLNSNKLNDIHSSNFQNLKNVTILILSYNSLSEKVINCDNIQNLVNVQVLSISHNQIKKINDCTFRNLKNLTNLTLSANKIEKIPSSFSGLTKLRELDLSQNKIREIPLGVFDNLLNLERLNLSYNQIKHFDLNVLNHSHKLIFFDISHNDIKDLDLKLLIKQLPSLKVVDFDKHLVKCDVYSDIMQYLDENSVVYKSCATSESCCKESNFFIILIISIIILLLSISVLSCVLCFIFFFKRSKTYIVELPMK